MQDGIEREALRRALAEPPLLDAAVAALIADGRLRPSGNALSLPGHVPAPDAATRAVIEALHAVYASAGLEPPDLEDLPAEFATRPDLALLIRFLERDGRLFRMTGSRLVCARSLSEGESLVRSQMVVGEQFGVADFRDVLNLSRRHLIPLLEHFDRTGVTRREGEKRVLLPGRRGA